MVEETEEAQSQGVRVGPVGPGEQQLEEAFELLHVDAVLLQVGQAGVVALCGVAAAAPVAAGQVLCLGGQQLCHIMCKIVPIKSKNKHPAEWEGVNA